MCQMEFQVQGKTDDYVRLEKDFDGIEFLGQFVNFYFPLKYTLKGYVSSQAAASS